MPYSQHTQLLSTTTIANSEWWRVDFADRIVLQISGISASEDTVQIWGSNYSSAASGENQIGSDITSDDLVTVDPGFMHLRVKRSRVSTGSRITVIGRAATTWSR